MAIEHERLASLDGLRAISIAFVLLGHLQGTSGFPELAFAHWLAGLAHLGVAVFFVISGFLITTLLRTERACTGAVSLKRFYVRRALRIFPAFYTFLVVMMLASAAGLLTLGAADLGFSLTYTVSYYAGRSWTIGHLWSLSVEEQFYLIWPFLFVVLAKRHAFLAAVAAFVAGPLVRTAMDVAFPLPSPWNGLEIFPAVADSIATGCILALSRRWLLGQSWYLRLTASNVALLVLVPAVLAINALDGYALVDLLGSPVKLLAIAVLIEASTRRADSLVGRALNLKPVAFVGVLSYSIYLWQQPFINRHSTAAWCAFPLNIVLALGFALLSYYLVERPFLRLRKRIEEPVSPSRAAGATLRDAWAVSSR